MGLTLTAYTLPTFMKATNDFSGGGLHFGADSIWHFTSYFTLYGKISGSLLEGHFQTKQNYLAVKTVVPGSRKCDCDVSAITWRLRSNVEGKIGLGFEQFFQNKKYYLAFNFGYSMSIWFNQNNLVDFAPYLGEGISPLNETARHGDLTMQGLTFEACFAF